MSGFKYYKTKTERYNYKGERYFRLNTDTNEVVQVVVSCGDKKKGRGNMFGVVRHNSANTLYANYIGHEYTEECDELDFRINFDEIVKQLR